MNDEPRSRRDNGDPGDGPDDAGSESVPEQPAGRVVRRSRGSLSAEERAFLERYRRDMPPHHDSSWG